MEEKDEVYVKEWREDRNGEEDNEKYDDWEEVGNVHRRIAKKFRSIFKVVIQYFHPGRWH